MNTASTYTSFKGHQRIASGSLAINALAVKRALASDPAAALLTFCDQTGRVVDLDLRGSDADMLARLPRDEQAGEASESAGADLADAAEHGGRGRGRPKLGVVAREVTLLPRHWDWLAAQPGGSSVTLRKLVDEARRVHGERDRLRHASESAYHFMSVMAGDMAGFEEAARALFANDAASLRHLIAAWPADVRDYLGYLADPAPPPLA